MSQELDLEFARQRLEQHLQLKERVYRLFNLVRDFDVYNPDEAYHNQFDDELVDELESLLVLRHSHEQARDQVCFSK